MNFLDNYLDKLIFLISAALVFIPLERVFPRVRRQGWLRNNLKLDVMYMLLGAVAIMLLSAIFITVAVVLLGPLVPESARSFVRSQNFAVQALMLIVAGDLYYYWAHRLFHTFPVLWKFHAIHHSIEDMDWIAAHRTHPVDTAITNSGAFIIALLFDFGALAILIFGVQFSWHSLLKHSNVSVSWGPLRWLYLTPTFHHWHHANVEEAYDKNFAGQLPVWDLVFGTAIMKQDEGPDRYGVNDPVPKSFLGSLAYPFRPRQTGREEAEPVDAVVPGNAVAD